MCVKRMFTCQTLSRSYSLSARRRRRACTGKNKQASTAATGRVTIGTEKLPVPTKYSAMPPAIIIAAMTAETRDAVRTGATRRILFFTASRGVTQSSLGEDRSRSMNASVESSDDADRMSNVLITASASAFPSAIPPAIAMPAVVTTDEHSAGTSAIMRLADSCTEYGTGMVLL